MDDRRQRRAQKRYAKWSMLSGEPGEGVIIRPICVHRCLIDVGRSSVMLFARLRKLFEGSLVRCKIMERTGEGGRSCDGAAASPVRIEKVRQKHSHIRQRQVNLTIESLTSRQKSGMRWALLCSCFSCRSVAGELTCVSVRRTFVTTPLGLRTVIWRNESTLRCKDKGRQQSWCWMSLQEKGGWNFKKGIVSLTSVSGI